MSNIITRKILEKEVSFECIETNTKLIENLKCSICLDFFIDPYISKCQHNFCKNCITTTFGVIKKNTKCPLCRTEIHSTDLIKNIHLSETISTLTIKCLQSSTDKVCSSIIDICGIHNHVKNECDYFKINCRYSCDFNCYRYNVKSHEQICLKNPKFKINCSLCLESIYAIDRENHRNICSKEIIECDYYCGEKILRSNIKIHYKEFGEKHAESLKDLYFKQSNELSKRKIEISRLTAKNKKHVEMGKRMVWFARWRREEREQIEYRVE